MNRESLTDRISGFEPVRQNIETVAKLEEQFLQQRTMGDRVADAISAFTGSMACVLLHVAFFALYIWWNLGRLPGMRPFDPYPFMLLSMILSLEAIFLSTFVLMKQNRMSRRSDQRAHLDLQINMLTEREITLVLQVLQMLAGRLGLEKELNQKEMEQFTADTSVEALASELQEKLPDKC